MTRTMLRRAALAGAVIVALSAASACGSDDHTSTGSSHDTTAATTAAGSPPAGLVFNEADVAFAQHMIVHHRQAVEMSELAVSRAASTEVKELAARIKAAQGPEITTMTGWLGSWSRPVPEPQAHGAGHEGMPGMMSDTDMAQFADASGAAFDKKFLSMMIAHHEGAITMAGEEAKAGSNPDAKALADKISADQRSEITAMTGLLASM